MTIKHLPTVERYASQVMDIMAALENLQEFVSSLPAPDEDETVPGMDYGHIGTLNEIHSLVTAAMEHADRDFAWRLTGAVSAI